MAFIQSHLSSKRMGWRQDQLLVGSVPMYRGWLSIVQLYEHHQDPALLHKTTDSLVNMKYNVPHITLLRIINSNDTLERVSKFLWCQGTSIFSYQSSFHRCLNMMRMKISSWINTTYSKVFQISHKQTTQAPLAECCPFFLGATTVA